eukprot:1162034-Pelagomonas_calceolata.AAC.7
MGFSRIARTALSWSCWCGGTLPSRNCRSCLKTKQMWRAGGKGPLSFSARYSDATRFWKACAP